MPTHTTPPPHADQTDQTAEPARRASRFDERGIALQTIIIMVVLLAIAGSVAAVLLSRAGEETANLEDSVSSTAFGITNKNGCQLGGHAWQETTAASAQEVEALNIARPMSTAWTIANSDDGGDRDWCKPKN